MSQVTNKHGKNTGQRWRTSPQSFDRLKATIFISPRSYEVTKSGVQSRPQLAKKQPISPVSKIEGRRILRRDPLSCFGREKRALCRPQGFAGYVGSQPKCEGRRRLNAVSTRRSFDSEKRRFFLTLPLQLPDYITGSSQHQHRLKIQPTTPTEREKAGRSSPSHRRPWHDFP